MFSARKFRSASFRTQQLQFCFCSPHFTMCQLTFRFCVDTGWCLFSYIAFDDAVCALSLWSGYLLGITSCDYKVSQRRRKIKMECCIKPTKPLCVNHRFWRKCKISRWQTGLRFDIVIMLGGIKAPAFYFPGRPRERNDPWHISSPGWRSRVISVQFWYLTSLGNLSFCGLGSVFPDKIWEAFRMLRVTSGGEIYDRKKRAEDGIRCMDIIPRGRGFCKVE